MCLHSTVQLRAQLVTMAGRLSAGLAVTSKLNSLSHFLGVEERRIINSLWHRSHYKKKKYLHPNNTKKKSVERVVLGAFIRLTKVF